MQPIHWNTCIAAKSSLFIPTPPLLHAAYSPQHLHCFIQPIQRNTCIASKSSIFTSTPSLLHPAYSYQYYHCLMQTIHRNTLIASFSLFTPTQTLLHPAYSPQTSSLLHAAYSFPFPGASQSGWGLNGVGGRTIGIPLLSRAQTRQTFRPSYIAASVR